MPTLNRNHGVFECLDAHGRVLYDVPAETLEIELAEVQALPAGAFLIDMIDGDDVYQVVAVNGATVEVQPLKVLS